MHRIVAAAALAFLCAFGAVPLRAVETVTPPPIAARAYFLLDVQGGEVLASASADDRFEPASLTKVMTAYVAFAAIRDAKVERNRTVTMPPRATQAPGARMFAKPGQAIALDDLVRAMIVQSANDAALAIADAVAGSEAAFVAQMNAQAALLGLTQTRFANPTGQPAQGHYASARDLARLTVALIRDFPQEYALYSLREFAFNGVTQANRNRLLWTDPTVDGVKTGFTEAAAYCLIASARRGERRLIAVVLGAQTESLRIAETQKLLNFGFQAYDTRLLYRQGEPLVQAAIYKGTKSVVRVGFDRDVWLTLPRDRFTGLRALVETRQPFVAPLAAGEKAGIMKLMRGNAPVAEVPVVALEDVPVAGFLSRGWDTLRLLALPAQQPPQPVGVPKP